MEFKQNDIPIYIQVAKGLEDDIFIGLYKEGEQIPSTTEISLGYSLNPATVLKGMNLLVQEGIIFKKRGVGMFVSEGAREKVKEKRMNSFKESFIEPLVKEARNLGFDKKDIIEIIGKEIDYETANK
ncbi:MAG: GntR family transcriptional regulator [Sphaerochaetaceae bacterium]|nr:GntR family transcriptional regulator [Sphaerochaetaceae bacterium]MDC7237573.1 GntR family transcriptional regulator [Sphaerochaetaceae bacterium]MDC7249211.1 GntR family transcriptional regulator [Sphaerochaetaceae bacterium]